MAEAVLREKIKQKGLSNKLSVSSAATSSWEVGNIPHRGTRNILDKQHISYEKMRARQITKNDFDYYDWIIGMDNSNIEDLTQLASADQRKKVHLFMEPIEGEESLEVPDPYYTGNFNQTFQMVDKGTDAWLNKIKPQLEDE